MTYDPEAAVEEFEETFVNEIWAASEPPLTKEQVAALPKIGKLLSSKLRAALLSAYRAGEAGKEAEYERGKRDAYINVLADASGGLMDAVMARAPWDVEEEIRDKARRHGVTGEEFCV